MLPASYSDLDATALAAAIRSGEYTAAAVLEAAIERIERLNPGLNAVTHAAFDLARRDLVAADSLAPFFGVPFLAKDMNIAVRGLPLTQASRWLAGLPVAAEDAPLAARWRAAGLSILGRTSLPEFAADFVCEPTAHGPTRNPWDPRRSPGGSSGGSAAAVAAGLVPMAHGTDSGGSIRVPAAACGLVGLKPSRGLVPVGPAHDELAGGFDCEHVITRSVRDSAAMLDLTAGADDLARTPLRVESGEYARATRDIPRPLRVGLVLADPSGRLPDDSVSAAVESVGRHLAAAGHEVRGFTFPRQADVGEAAAVIWMTAIAEDIDYHIPLVGRPPERGEIEFISYECWQRGRAWRATEYVAARRLCSGAVAAMVAAMREVDVLLLPTTATLPPVTGEIDGRTGEQSFEQWGAAAYAYAPYTELFNITGMPAISLPLAFTGEGLPIGVQLAAPLGADARLLSLAAWLELEMPWAPRLAGLRRRWA